MRGANHCLKLNLYKEGKANKHAKDRNKIHPSGGIHNKTCNFVQVLCQLPKPQGTWVKYIRN